MSETAVSSQGEVPVEGLKRRLAPQFSFKQEPATNVVDNKSRPFNTEPTKKAVLRYTREQMVAMRKQSDVLKSMAHLVDVINESAQEPVCFQVLEPEDVIKLWNAGSNKENRMKARPRRDEEDDSKDLWNDVAEDSHGFDGAAFDFSKITENSSRLRTELDKLKQGEDKRDLDDEGFMDDKGHEDDFDGGFGDDVMEDLMKESMNNTKYTVANSNEAGNKLQEALLNKNVNTTSALPPSSVAVTQMPSSQSAQTTKVDFGNLLLGPNGGMLIVNDSAVPLINDKPSTFNNNNNNKQLLNSNSLSTSSPAVVVHEVVELKFNKPSTVEVEWFYRDPQQEIQGPFSQKNMQLWNNEGYFTADLPIKLRGWGQFYPFIEIFPDLRNAFSIIPVEPFPKVSADFNNSQPMFGAFSVVPSPPSGGNQSLPSKEVLSVPVGNTKSSTTASELKPVKAVEVAAFHDHSNEISPSKSTKPSQTTSAQSNNGDQNRSAMAKKILGIGETPVEVSKTRKQEESSMEMKNNGIQDKRESKISKGWKKENGSDNEVVKPLSSLKDIQTEQQSKNQRKTDYQTTESNVEGIQQPSTTTTVAPKQAWSTSVPNTATVDASGKSLKEIMNEELSQRKDQVSVETRPATNSWAAKAKAATTGSSVPPSTSFRTGSSVRTVDSRTITIEDSKPSVPSPPSAIRLPVIMKNEFGGKKMNKDMLDWCVQQLRKINGTEDLTMIEFCWTLSSAVEIRETFSQVLGSSVQVANFATEFIRYKDEGKRPTLNLAETSVNNGGAGGGAGVNSGFTSIKKKKSVK